MNKLDGKIKEKLKKTLIISIKIINLETRKYI
jgi:hypothetical protein